MAYDIGPRITVAGEQEFNQAIKKINSNLKVLGSEMKAVTSAFDGGEASEEQLTNKSKILSQQLEAQKNKLSTLTEQYDKQKSKLAGLKQELDAANAEFGEGSVQAQKLQFAYDKQAQVVDKLKVAMNETTASINKMSGGVSKAVPKMSKFEASIEKISEKASKMGEKMKPISKVAAGMGAALLGTVPATHELRTDLSFLSANANRVGVSLKNQEQAFSIFNSMTGETDSSVEALSNLFEAGFDNKKIIEAVNGVSGAYTQFMDTLKVEGIADGIQETLATGKSVGQFGEYLDRVGIGAEKFDMQLAKCTTSAEKQNLVLDALAKGGANSALKSYQKNNGELLKYNKAVTGFQTAVAKVAEAIVPLITPVIEALISVINKFTGMPKPIQQAIVLIIGAFAGLGPVLMALGQMSMGIQALKGISGVATIFTKSGEIIKTAVGTLKNFVVTALGFIKTAISGLFNLIMAHPVIAIITAIIAAVVILYNKCEWFRNMINNIISKLKGYWESFKNKVSEVVSSVKSFFSGLASSISNKMSSIKNSIVNGFNRAISFIVSLPSRAFRWGADFIDGMKRGIQNRINGIIDAVKGIGEKIKSYLHFSRPDVGPLREYETWMPDFMEGLGKGIRQNEKAVINPVANLANNLKNGINNVLDPNGRFMASMSVNAVNNAVVVQPIIYLGNKELSANLTNQVIKKMGAKTKGIERIKGNV